VDNDEFEFVEIVNVANHAVDLRGVQLVETDEGGQLRGVRFTFESQILQPRAAIVVVENVQAFQARYGDAIPIALGRDRPADDEGEYGGKLSNAGDLLTLLDAQGNLIRQFMYDDKWQPTSDGEGRSLELTQVWQDERTELERGSLWQASGVIGGTPGQAIGFGDLNVDREVSLSDIDLLFAVMAHFSAEAAPRWFDLNVDDKVDSQDALRLVTDALGTRPGDADLDGNVDFDDLVTLANRFGQRATSWAEGDFDGSGDVAFADFVLLANNFGFVRPAQPLPDQTALSIDLAAALAAEQQKKES
jgi:hypothetical protein